MSRANVATPPGIVELSSENARVAFVPAMGGRIIALDLGGRQWLTDGDRGGITECFPTVSACTMSNDSNGCWISSPRQCFASRSSSPSC